MTETSRGCCRVRWGGLSGFIADFLGVFAVFFVVAGELVPGVNEPHYWTKSAHFWNPNLARGDLFLESGNAHWLFYATFGGLADIFELPIAVWIARFLMWGFLALGWVWMVRSLFDALEIPKPLIATLCASGWLAGMYWGHWAGEWVVGGAEAKVMAYACIFGGLGFLFRKQLWIGWALIGLGSAYHIVTGVWVIACSILVSQGWDKSGGWRWRVASWKPWLYENGGPLLLAGALASIGAIPAIAMDWGASAEDVTKAAVIQVYGRLGHHLAPTLFSELRWQSFGFFVAIGCMVHWFCLRTRWKTWPLGMRWMIVNAWLALGIAVIGTAIDALVGGFDRNLSAKILKYYWFRWNDVAWPLGVAVPIIGLAYGVIRFQPSPKGAAWIAGAWAMGMSALLLTHRYFENTEAWIPYGDKARFLSKWDDEVAQRSQYRDWLAVCAWIRENTQPDGLWLTPRNQQSFKWHTQRAELACTKDMPQNSTAIVEWSKRLEDAYKLNEAKILSPWTTQNLWELKQKYPIRYVLVDLRVPQQGPPLLPILYPPPGVSNPSFSVFEFPEPSATTK